MGIFLIAAILLMLLLILGGIILIIILIVKAVKRKKRTSTVYAAAMAKREAASPYDEPAQCYILFKLETGEHIELAADRYSYELINENDKGWLKFRDGRFLELERD